MVSTWWQFGVAPKQMANQKNLLWLDSIGGLTVGVIVLALCPLLAKWHNLTVTLIVSMGLANLLYGCYSFSLARRRQRPLHLIQSLAIANIIWGIVCFGLFGFWRESVSLLGAIHLVSEGIYVGGLGLLEWRWREALILQN